MTIMLRWCLEGFFFNILSTFSAFPFQFVGIRCDGPEFYVLLSLRRNANLRDTLWHGIPLNFVCARVAYGWMSCGCVLQKNMLQKKICTGTNDKLLDYPVTLYSIFLEILCHILSSRIASKWQPELRWKSAQKLKKKILVWLQVLRKKSIDKNKIYQKKTLKNNLILFEVKSHSTEIVSFVIKSKLNVFGLTSQSFVGICAAVLEISKQTQKMRLFFRIEVRGIYNNEVLIFFHETTAE